MYFIFQSEDGSMTDRSVNASQVETDAKALFKVAKQLGTHNLIS